MLVNITKLLWCINLNVDNVRTKAGSKETDTGLPLKTNDMRTQIANGAVSDTWSIRSSIHREAHSSLHKA